MGLRVSKGMIARDCQGRHRHVAAPGASYRRIGLRVSSVWIYRRAGEAIPALLAAALSGVWDVRATRWSRTSSPDRPVRTGVSSAKTAAARWLTSCPPRAAPLTGTDPTQSGSDLRRGSGHDAALWSAGHRRGHADSESLALHQAGDLEGGLRGPLDGLSVG